MLLRLGLGAWPWEWHMLTFRFKHHIITFIRFIHHSRLKHGGSTLDVAVRADSSICAARVARRKCNVKVHCLKH